MSKKARLIMYPLLGVVVVFFIYTMFFMEKPVATPLEDGQPTTEQVEVQTVNTEKE